MCNGGEAARWCGCSEAADPARRADDDDVDADGGGGGGGGARASGSGERFANGSPKAGRTSGRLAVAVVVSFSATGESAARLRGTVVVVVVVVLRLLRGGCGGVGGV